jgi:V/A-type H+-transporting ATPase subunit E
MQKAEQEVLTDAYKLIQDETSGIRSGSIREMSRRDLGERKKVLTRRKDIMNDIFAKAEKKLMNFTAAPEYTDFLCRMLKNIVTLLPSEGTVYIIAKKDERLAGELSSICPKESRVDISDEIKIGGIRAVNEQSGQIIDNTLDSKLESQHDWFTITSGLTVG